MKFSAIKSHFPLSFALVPSVHITLFKLQINKIVIARSEAMRQSSYVLVAIPFSYRTIPQRQIPIIFTFTLITIPKVTRCKSGE